ncbi:MAG TPA: hypothetical protein VF522_11305, partial [Ramlibacter sp.]|uniref:hypothetical protein n=1 Tax=Ramlibacter sp. TaxID=1917967 RepID=UPI002ED408CA
LYYKGFPSCQANSGPGRDTATGGITFSTRAACRHSGEGCGQQNYKRSLMQLVLQTRMKDAREDLDR